MLNHLLILSLRRASKSNVWHLRILFDSFFLPLVLLVISLFLCYVSLSRTGLGKTVKLLLSDWPRHSSFQQSNSSWSTHMDEAQSQLFDGIVRNATSVKSSWCVLVSLSFCLSRYMSDISSSLAVVFAIAPILFPFDNLYLSAFILIHSFSSSAPTSCCLALELSGKLNIFPSCSDVWACSPQLSGSARPEVMNVTGMLSPSDQLLWTCLVASYLCSLYLGNAA